VKKFAEGMAKQIRSIEKHAGALEEYSWPGNIRNGKTSPRRHTLQRRHIFNDEPAYDS
jgi:transcriptional regulator with PAS, ATPase and Fis domain